MKTRTKSPEAAARRALVPFVEALIRATPQRLREPATGVRATSRSAVVRTTAERLVARFGDDDGVVRAGAADARMALGSIALPALEAVALANPSGRWLLELAPVLMHSVGDPRDESGRCSRQPG